jgi:SAM-dependent methyltransferase
MVSADDVKEQQRTQWASRAEGWDSFNDRLGRPLAPVSAWLCHEARLATGLTVLDLACGTGQPALMAATLVGPTGRVIATDLAPEMVEETAARAEDAGLKNLHALVMDAENIRLEDETVDAVTMQHGLMFCPEPARVVAEVRRVLRPGGRFAVSVWGDPANTSSRQVIERAFAKFGRAIPPPRMGVPGGLGLAVSGALEEVLSAAGLTQIWVVPMLLKFRFVSFDHFWHFEAEGSPEIRAFVSDSSLEEVEHFRHDLQSVLVSYTANDSIELERLALCAVCEKTSAQTQ